jgi:hypothetical protein
MRRILASGLLLSAIPPAAHAQAEDFLSAAPATAGAADLAKELSNPVASLISVPFQFNLDRGGGFDDDASKLTLNVQPVIPVSIGPTANLIIRTIVPIAYQDGLSGPNNSEFGLGDTIQSFFYSPAQVSSGGITWGAGPVFLYPTATSNKIGGEKWGAGPTVVVLKQAGQSTIGVLANHIWSVAGSRDRSDVSATFLQPFYSYTTRTATTYGVSSESTYNWKTKKWIVPIIVSASQLVKLGKQPISFGLGARYYAATPVGGPHWGARFTATLLFPKK